MKASLSYVASLCDEAGLFEHATGTKPAPGEGQCSDDNGRALKLACMLSNDPQAHGLALVTLGFLEEAWNGTEFRLRRRLGTWEGQSDDSSGRALLGLGYAGAHAPWPEVRSRARELFDKAASWRSLSPRAMSYAGLGAAAILAGGPDGAAGALIEATAHMLSGPGLWYESRLAYANALLCEAQMVSGAVLGDSEMRRRGLARLSWLIAREGFRARTDHFSFTPVGGGDLEETGARFDQQPIEAEAMAEAAYRAFCYTGDEIFASVIGACVGWFLGENDAWQMLYDPKSGGCFDGLGEHDVNHNEGAESALALVATFAVQERLGAWRERGGGFGVRARLAAHGSSDE